MVQALAVLEHTMTEMINMFENYAEPTEREGCPLGMPTQVKPGEVCAV